MPALSTFVGAATRSPSCRDRGAIAGTGGGGSVCGVMHGFGDMLLAFGLILTVSGLLVAIDAHSAAGGAGLLPLNHVALAGFLLMAVGALMRRKSRDPADRTPRT
jgi:hypothetical protein